MLEALRVPVFADDIFGAPTFAFPTRVFPRTADRRDKREPFLLRGEFVEFVHIIAEFPGTACTDDGEELMRARFAAFLLDFLRARDANIGCRARDGASHEMPCHAAFGVHHELPDEAFAEKHAVTEFQFPEQRCRLPFRH